MEIRIGVIHSPKEVRVEVDGDGAPQVQAIEQALAGKESVLWLTDKHGNRSGVPVDKIGYVEIESDHGTRKVGFGSPS
jgi:Protein of unknown function (DUF3107)